MKPLRTCAEANSKVGSLHAPFRPHSRSSSIGEYIILIYQNIKGVRVVWETTGKMTGKMTKSSKKRDPEQEEMDALKSLREALPADVNDLLTDSDCIRFLRARQNGKLAR
jgi:hypothetical protein